MFTSMDKAIAALIMAIIYLLNNYLATSIDVMPETVQNIVVVLSPLIVWLTPNKKKET